VTPAVSPVDEFAERMEKCLPAGFSGGIGLAVSGGSDSTALLHLAHSYATSRDIRLCAMTVDHGLRPEAGGEAKKVAEQCARLGIGHETARWDNWDGRGNLQNQARAARLRIISDWAKSNGLGVVALGHTLDDQAETVLLRLARGSGVDGLSAMADRRQSHGVTWVRPLLEFRRQDLRAWLRANQISWAEDPSNDDPKYDRVRVRNALKVLDDIGVSPERLAGVASRMRSAREVLEMATQSAARDCATVRHGAVELRLGPYLGQAYEVRRRLLAHALRWVGLADYAPRQASLDAAMNALESGQTTTLHGCLIMASGDQCLIAREPAGAAGATASIGDVWDSRWHVTGPNGVGLEVRCLGETGLKSCPDWRDCGVPRAVLLASPAVWSGDRLVSAPLAGLPRGYKARLVRRENDFESSILTH